MKPFEIRQGRIQQLTQMALRGENLESLEGRMLKWKIAPATQSSYMKEVRERLNKAGATGENSER